MKKLIPFLLAFSTINSFAQITQEQQEKHCTLFSYKVKLGFLIKKLDPRMTEQAMISAFGKTTKKRVDAGKITKEAGAKEYIEYSESIQMAFTFNSSDDPDKVKARTYDMCLNARKTAPML